MSKGKKKQDTDFFEELATSVIEVEPDDLPKLAQINSLFKKITDDEKVQPVMRDLAQKGADISEQIILNELTDPDEGINMMGKAVEVLQQMTACIERGESVDSVSLPDWFEGESLEEEEPTAAAAPPAEDECDEIPADADMELLGEFITESLDHIQNSEAALLELESNADPESINAVFRAFHTIKGTSGFLGFKSINKVAHKAETLLDRARKEEIELTDGYADLAFDSCDALKQLLGYIKARLDGEEGEQPEGIGSLLTRLDSPDEAAQATPQPPRVGDLLVAGGKATREEVEAAAAEDGREPIGTKLIKKNAAKPKDVAGALRTQKAVKGDKAADTSVRVSTARLDNLINMVGELVIAQSMVSQHNAIVEGESQTLLRNVSQLSKITRDLQELGLSMRMVPLKNTFQKMARLVRDLGKKSGKAVRFTTDGEDTEIDRNMVESINDPLVHMMRNCVDHGIEMPEDRAAAGKEQTGTVLLRAYHSAGNVVIEIIDDGKGLDREKILAKAIEKGLVDSGRELSDAEVFNLIMLPGFSTAAKVTDVSGRGVGTDVVKRNIEALRGKVEIASEKGVGTTFTVRLPLTLAIIDGMLMRVGPERYILPTAGIREAFRPVKGAISTIGRKAEVVMVRRSLIPIVRLHHLFGVKDCNENLDDSLLVVIEVDGKHCAMLIDEIIGQQQVVIKSLGSALGTVRGISGAAILADGRVGLILDPSGVMAVALEQTPELQAQAC